MLELFTKNPEYLIPTVAIVCTALVIVIPILGGIWRSVRQADMEASLKHDMLNRGMPVEEIERVLRATSSVPASTESGDPVSDNEYYLVEKLVDEGKSAEEIERILRVFRTPDGRPANKQRNVTAITPAEAQRV